MQKAGRPQSYLKQRHHPPYQRIVVKLGTNLLYKKTKQVGLSSSADLAALGVRSTLPAPKAQDDLCLNTEFIEGLCKQISYLRSKGRQILLVSSGAVQTGKSMLHAHGSSMPLQKAKGSIIAKQALSAIGQAPLIGEYQRAMAQHGITVAQILLTAKDLRDRQSYLNISHSLAQLEKWKVLPIINENDSITTDELQYGENDVLSAACAALFQADCLCILTSVEGFFYKGRRESIIPKVLAEHFTATNTAHGRTSELPQTLGSGGMSSKLRAAELCTRSGIDCCILPGYQAKVLCDFLEDSKDIGTLFYGRQQAHSHPSLTARKKWLLFSITKASVRIDEGARKAIEEHGASLLGVGVHSIEGYFHIGEIVEIRRLTGESMGRGIVRYGSATLRDMISLSKKKAGKANMELIHRDDLVLE